MLHYDQDTVEAMLLDSKPLQHETNPLFFRFYFKPGHPYSEELKTWFDDHKVEFTVFEQNYAEGMNEACVDFRDDPGMAVLFKLAHG